MKMQNKKVFTIRQTIDFVFGEYESRELKNLTEDQRQIVEGLIEKGYAVLIHNNTHFQFLKYPEK